MKRVLVKSVHGAFGYVMEHYYPFGMAAEAAEQGALTDTYAVISIQDSHTGGFGVQFTENQFCKGVLTLLFDDIVTEVEGAVLFDDEMADEIIRFIDRHTASVDTLLVHCYAGQSRSRAVGAFAVEMLGGDNRIYFSEGSPNQYIYDVLESAWVRWQLSKI
ncbi:MAG: hypothetical protein IJ060_08105 [Oscillospiraceae bacterium]|nr:hypothetical protein [Oscillospiraceae bacterium]